MKNLQQDISLMDRMLVYIEIFYILVPNHYTCHEECRNGCWGPTAKMCLNCRNHQYKDECLPDCKRPMLFSLPDNAKQCFDCSAECNSTCTGPVCNHYNLNSAN